MYYEIDSVCFDDEEILLYDIVCELLYFDMVIVEIFWFYLVGKECFWFFSNDFFVVLSWCYKGRVRVVGWRFVVVIVGKRI